MSRVIMLLFVCSLLATNAFAQTNKELQIELIQMFQEDQKARQAFIDSKMQDEKLTFKISEIDRRNTTRLKEIVKQYGWPSKTLIGEDGAAIAFLLVQHADLNLDFQKECLILMEELALRNRQEVYLPGIAYLTDRIRIADKKRQLYGSQVFIYPQTKEIIIYPIEDPDNLEKRRSAYGLPLMKEYVEQIKKAYGITEDLNLEHQ